MWGSNPFLAEIHCLLIFRHSVHAYVRPYLQIKNIYKYAQRPFFLYFRRRGAVVVVTLRIFSLVPFGRLPFNNTSGTDEEKFNKLELLTKL